MLHRSTGTRTYCNCTGAQCTSALHGEHRWYNIAVYDAASTAKWWLCSKVLAAESNTAEQNMIEQSHITALAKTAGRAMVSSKKSETDASACTERRCRVYMEAPDFRPGPRASACVGGSVAPGTSLSRLCL